jgi:hypothetical protein
MIDFIPYFAGIVTVLFGVAFFYSIRDREKNKTK